MTLAFRVEAMRYLKRLKDKGRRATSRSLKFFDQVWLPRTRKLLVSAMREAQGSGAKATQEQFWRDVIETLDHELKIATRRPGRPQERKRAVGLILHAMSRKSRGRPRTTIVLTEQEQKAWRHTIFMVKLGLHYGHRLNSRGGDSYADHLVASRQLGKLIPPLMKSRDFIDNAETESNDVAIEEATAHLAPPLRDQLRRYLTRHYPRLKRQYSTG